MIGLRLKLLGKNMYIAGVCEKCSGYVWLPVGDTREPMIHQYCGTT